MAYSSRVTSALEVAEVAPLGSGEVAPKWKGSPRLMFAICETVLLDAMVKPAVLPSNTVLATAMLAKSPFEARSIFTFHPAGAGGPPGLVSNPTPPEPESQDESSKPSVCQVVPSDALVGTSALSGAVGPMNDVL